MGNRISTGTKSRVQRSQLSIKPYEGMRWKQLGETMHGCDIYDDLNDRTRQSVAISHDGNKVVFGPPDFPRGVSNGLPTVKVFNFDHTSWNEVVSFSGWKTERYGKNIALSGDGRRLAIGAEFSNARRGRVEVYQYGKKNQWKPIGDQLVGLKPYECFGKSISLSGDGGRIAIRAISTIGGKNRCSVRILDFIGDTMKEIMQMYPGWSAQVMEFLGDEWQQIGQTIIDEKYNLFYGAVSLSSDGKVVAVGYPDTLNGSVRIFRYSSEQGTWIKVGQTLHGAANCNNFGFSLSINGKGDVLAISGRRADNYVQVFCFDGNKWNQMGKTIYEEAVRSFSLSSNGKRIAIGSACHSNRTSGCVEIFDYDENDWVPTQIPGPHSSTFFGFSVSLSADGNRLAVGSILNKSTLFTVYELRQPGFNFSYWSRPSPSSSLEILKPVKQGLNVKQVWRILQRSVLAFINGRRIDW